ncbi:MAG: hypothetical protein LBC71_04335 [Oscillospiraceae bacterium]|jgi:hypothetical protein|nr:hypothetical protein [Oscillospiraceae bacterium]
MRKIIVLVIAVVLMTLLLTACPLLPFLDGNGSDSNGDNPSDNGNNSSSNNGDNNNDNQIQDISNLPEDFISALREISISFSNNNFESAHDITQDNFAQIADLYDKLFNTNQFWIFDGEAMSNNKNATGLVLTEFNQEYETIIMWHGTFQNGLPEGNAVMMNSSTGAHKYSYSKSTFIAGRANGITEKGGFDATGEHRWTFICNYDNGYANGLAMYTWAGESYSDTWEYEIRNGGVVMTDRLVWSEENGGYLLDGDGLIFTSDNFEEHYYNLIFE